MLYKSLPLEVKDVSVKEGIVQGYYAAFNNWDDGGDMILNGAFKKTIKERGPESKQPRIQHLFNHDPDLLLGRPQVLKEDDKGLYFETKIVPTTLGRDVLMLYENGVITEHSIGYDVVKVSYDESVQTMWGPGRKIHEIKLWDGSSVTWGMNSQTPTLGVKGITNTASSKSLDAVRTQIERMELALKNSGSATDEMCEFLEKSIQFCKEQLSALIEGREPTEVTPPDNEPSLARELQLLTLKMKTLLEVN